MTAPALRPVGDGALLVDWGGEIDEGVFARVVALDRALADAPPAGMIETVPAYTTLLVVFDALVTDHTGTGAAVIALLDRSGVDAGEATEHVVPVCYDGPDLATVAERAGLAPDEVIAAHLAGAYRVFMYGFAPGYAYLGGVPEAIRMPRKATAERGHPVGSVMIAGAQCLITTLPMPTGWRVIGRTSFKVLDALAGRPFRFEPGDRVRFERVAG